jgi:hypothetical protein
VLVGVIEGPTTLSPVVVCPRVVGPLFKEGAVTRRIRLLSIAALTVGALATASLLSGCGAGQIATTADTKPAIQGADATLQISSPGTAYDNTTLGVRNATIVYNGINGYPAGGAAPLSLYLFNNTPAPMTLTGVKATFEQPNSTGSGSATVVLTGGPAASPSAPAPVQSAVPSGSPSPTGPVVTTPAPVGQANFQVVVPQSPAELLALTPENGTYLQLSQLTAPLTPGTVVHLVLTFTLGDGSTKVLGDDPNQPVDVPFGPPVTPAERSPISLSPTQE